jgi:iron complex transport system substrate-binding protein
MTLRDVGTELDAATRREFLALVAAGVLVACDATDPVDTTAVETRAVDHAQGTSEVPTDPRRIVVIDFALVFPAIVELGLGSSIIGAFPASTDESGIPEELIGQVEAYTDVVADGIMPDFEVIAGLEPDLIIGGDFYIADVFAELVAVAPTVALDVPFFQYGETLQAVAAALGREDRAAELLAQMDARITEVRDRVDVGRVSITQLLTADADPRIYGAASVLGAIVVDLGGEIVPADADFDDDGRIQVSAEQIDLAAGDTILNIEVGEDQIAHRETYGDTNALWTTLPAVEAGRVVGVDFEQANGKAGVAGYLALLDQLEEVFGS